MGGGGRGGEGYEEEGDTEVGKRREKCSRHKMMFSQTYVQHRKKTLSQQHPQTQVSRTVPSHSSGPVMHTRTKVSRCPHYRLPEVILPNYPCKAKVAQLDLWKWIARGKQHILRLQVTMNHILGVEIAEGRQNLGGGSGGGGYAKSC